MVSSEAFWDGVADKYAKTPIPDEADYAYTLERVRAHLKPGDRVLEIGCGTGSTARSSKSSLIRSDSGMTKWSRNETILLFGVFADFMDQIIQTGALLII